MTPRLLLTLIGPLLGCMILLHPLPSHKIPPLPSHMIPPQARWCRIIPRHPMLGCSCPSHLLPRLGFRILRHLSPIIMPHLLPNLTTPLPARLWPEKFNPTIPLLMRHRHRIHRLQNLSPRSPHHPRLGRSAHHPSLGRFPRLPSLGPRIPLHHHLSLGLMSLHHPRRCPIRLNPRIPCLPRLSPRIPHHPSLGPKISPPSHAEPHDPQPSAGGPNDPPPLQAQSRDPPPSQAQSRDPPPSQAWSHAPQPLQGQPQQADLQTCPPSPPAHAANVTRGTTLLIGSSLIKHVKPKSLHHTLVQTMRGASVLDAYHRLSNTTLGPYSQIVLQFGSNDLDKRPELVTLEYKLLLSAIKLNAKPNSKIYISAIPPRLDRRAKAAKSLNCHLSSLADPEANIFFVCHDDAFFTTAGVSVELSSYLARDRYHLNKKGTEVLLSSLNETLGFKKPHKSSHSPAPQNPHHHGSHQTPRRCYNCGETNHMRDRCWYGRKL